MENWKGLRVLIIGIARQGLALAEYLTRHGAQVVLNDCKTGDELQAAQSALAGLNVQWVFGSHPLALLDEMDLVCVSGGVPLSLPLVAKAIERGIPISNDSQIFLETAPCRVIGITGSAGKTTTTVLVGRIAQAALGSLPEKGPRVWVGGNIGSPLISVVDEMGVEDLAVMELSSFQLELMDRSPQIAAVLNLTPNHLDRHMTMESYRKAKTRILEYQKDTEIAVLGRDDPDAWDLAEHVKGRLISFGIDDPGVYVGTYLRDKDLLFHGTKAEAWLMSTDNIQLRGGHNLQNVLAACAISVAAELPFEAIQNGVNGFKGVPHRLEYVRTWKGADWYNDSIATAPERAMAAIRSFEEPLILLAGGRDKDLPWEDFASLVRERVDHLILFGEAAGKIFQAVGKKDGIQCESLREAVHTAAELAAPGDVVLLAPGGTSFDEFRDFEERGECFKKLVMQL